MKQRTGHEGRNLESLILASQGCGGDGFVSEDCEDDEDFDLAGIPCETCNESGGWWRCLSSPQWCEAHPLPGREGVMTSVEMGRKGGKSRMNKLTPKQRSALARKAARVRWEKKGKAK